MMKEAVYIVSGYMRSGTSMMMKCLESGGMKARYNVKKDETLNEKYAREDYHPNPGGFYELGRKEFDAPDFPETYADQLIKVLHWRLPTLPPFRYRVIFMLRDPKEIEVSYLKMFQQRPPFVLQKYHEMMKETLSMLEKRGDMDVLPVQHRDVISDPLATFTTIQEKGWPLLHIEKAVASVNPSLYRSHGKDLSQVRQTIPGLRTDLPDLLKNQTEESRARQ